MPYIILRGFWCHIIVLKVIAPTEEKIDDLKDSFCQEMKSVFDKFYKYHMKDFNAKVVRGDIFKQIIGNKNVHEISTDNGDRIVNFATSKNITINNTMFPHCNIHIYTWTSPDRKKHNCIDQILIDRPRHSGVLDFQSFRAAECDTDHYLPVAKVMERLASSE
jgi:hypothetical protein